MEKGGSDGWRSIAGVFPFRSRIFFCVGIFGEEGRWTTDEGKSNKRWAEGNREKGRMDGISGN